MATLKRITLKNFKSFKSAIIPIDRGFTAIMGPNGSGKSNIIDALVFVLGEGRLKLVRASRLRDLVYNKARDGEALVSLDIDVDGNTYTVSRSIDKKGHSVFRLNGKRVAKHEVISFLISRGISQRGYNFVLQGEITRLIKMSPKERREIIDEIAGISEYEEKKEEALNKLEEVSQRIREVSIILGEREEQLARLKREKEDAERYLDLKKYVASLRKGILVRDKKRIETEIKVKEEDLHSKREELAKLQAIYSEIEQKISSLEDEISSLTKKITEMYEQSGEGKYSSLLREKERIETDLKHTRMRIRDLEAEKTVLSDKIPVIDHDLEVVKRDLEEITARRREKDAEVNEIRRQIRSLEEIIKKEQEEAYALQRRVDEIEAQISRLREDYARLREDYGRVVGEYNAKVEEMKRKKERIEKKKKEAEEMKKRIREIEAEIKRLTEEKRDLLSAEKRLNQEYFSLQEEIKRLREEVGALRGATIALGTSLDVLNTLMDAQRRGELFGIRGFVASLIRYDKKYTRALESAAGRRLFYIVVDTADAAAEAIKFLKRHNLGRATFIPLDRVKPHVVDVPRVRGVIGRALDLVDFDPAVKRAMEYVFGDTVVVEDIDVAKNLDVRSVTIDGDIVERSGVMSGGSRRGESILKIFEAEKKRTEIREKETEIKRIMEDLQSIRRSLERINDQISSLSAERERLLSKVSIQEEEEADSVSELEKRMEEMSSRMTEIANKISDLEMERAKVMKQIRRTDSDLLERLNNLRNTYESKLGELHEYDSLIRERQMRARNLEEERNRISQKISAMEEEITSLKSSEEDLKVRLEKINAELEEIERNMQKQKEEIEEMLKRKEDLETKLREESKEMGRIRARMSQLERDIAVLEEELKNLLSRLHDLEREISEIEGDALDPLPPDPERRLRESLEEMRSLEPVNLRAIEEYEEMSKKVEEVKERIEKLEEERKAILNLISEIEKKKREIFLTTFREIARKFEEVYRDLTGGRARLRLTDEKNVFDSGLIIETSPKGKDMVNIDALSGGEKAMVALAFIFATVLFRPSPFYVLDEPDLMLDKINAEKMAKYIKKLSRTAQFIVVSHRDVVLKEADQIIGVYLGRDGSSVVEVRVPPSQSSS